MEKDLKQFLNLLFIKSEAREKFPIKFIEESTIWIKPWLENLEKLDAKPLFEKKENDYLKSIIIDSSITDILRDDFFKKEASKVLEDFFSLNKLIHSNGSLHDYNLNQVKNLIQNSNINVGGNFHLGDNKHYGNKIEKQFANGDIINGNKVVNNHFGPSRKEKKEFKSNNIVGIKEEAYKLIRKDRLLGAITKLIEYTEDKDSTVFEELLNLSGRYHELEKIEIRATLPKKELSIERNNIRNSLISIVRQINF